MNNLTTQDITNHLSKSAASGSPLPFSQLDMACALRESAGRGDIKQLLNFIHSSLSYIMPMNPNKGAEELIITNYGNIGFLAFLADNPRRDKIRAQELVRAYSNEVSFGPTMRFVKYLASTEGVDLCGVFEQDPDSALENIVLN